MSGKIEVRVTEHCRSAPESLFDAWLDPKAVRVWLTTALQASGLAGDIRQVEIDARPGGKFLLSDQRGGMEARHWGAYLELERPRRIVFTWIVDESEEPDPSRVTLTLTAEGNGCLAALVHEMDERWIDYVARTEAGWRGMLRAADTRQG